MLHVIKEQALALLFAIIHFEYTLYAVSNGQQRSAHLTNEENKVAF